jgi:glycosyltransferase involved in cell wall biosynthesis
MREPDIGVSVVVCCYREGELLRQAVESVLLQRQEGMELLVINDASPDETTNEVCRWASGCGARVVRHEGNRGLSGARNTGAREARGEVLCFLDGDDRLPPGTLAKIAEFFDAEPEVDLAVSDYRKIDRSGAVLGEVCMGAIFESGDLRPNLLLRDWQMLGTSPIRKELWRRVGGYDESPWLTNSVQDIDFFLRAFEVGVRAKHLPAVCYEWRMGAENMHVTQQHVAHDLLTIKNRCVLARISEQRPEAMANRGLHGLYAHGDWNNFRTFCRRLFRQTDWKNNLRYIASLAGVRLGKPQSRSSIKLSEPEIGRILAGASFAHLAPERVSEP